MTAISVLAAGCASPGGQGKAAGETRQVAHARGTAQVPVEPRRIVALEPLEIDTLVALGITPVGAAVAANVTELPKYLGVTGVTTVGTVVDPSIEAIAALKPDLILGTQARHARIFDRLDAIAPTVFIKTQADPWQQNVALISDALNRRAATDALLARYNERCAQIKTAAAVDGKTAQVIRPRGDGQFSLYGPDSFAGSALRCVGLTIPEQAWKDGLMADLSLENLSAAKADFVLVPTLKPGDPASVPASIRDNRASFPRVDAVDTAYWISGVGPKGGGLVLDDLERILRAPR
ncbi:ABC transporter substrate-binding protein [Tsukamurella serpentis]